jgi:hypothetical protein
VFAYQILYRWLIISGYLIVAFEVDEKPFYFLQRRYKGDGKFIVCLRNKFSGCYGLKPLQSFNRSRLIVHKGELYQMKKPFGTKIDM